jgi:hypothetical protein
MVAVPYIHALAPRMIELLGELTSQVTTANSTQLTKIKHDLIMEALSSLETLIEVAETGKKGLLLGLYLPLLITLLMDATENSPGTGAGAGGRTFRRYLHNYALQKLMAVGPLHPQEFRQIVGQVPRFRQKLETAVRNQQNQQNGQNSVRNSAQSLHQRDQPVIKLKTDFSNYSANN